MGALIFGERRNAKTPIARFAVLGLFALLGLHNLICAEGLDPLIQLPGLRGNGRRSRRVVLGLDDFGAVGDGFANDTQAFLDAWEAACSFSSRITVEIPAGKTYLIGPVDIGGSCRSKITLLISGTIVAPDDPGIWDHLDPHKWLYFHGINHLTVRGGGVINGMGEKWWARSCKTNATNPCRHAPTVITFHKCNNLKVHDLMTLNSQQMHVSFTSCSKVLASRLKVIAPAESPNTDGIHISASTSVSVRDSIIKTGDDCISIVDLSSKVRIRNIICGPGHGISIGSLGKSNSYSEVYDVEVDGAVFTGTENGVRIKTWQGGQGYAHGISFQNILMKNVANPIIIDQYYCDSFVPCANQTDAVKVSGISFVGIKGTSATEEAIIFACSDSYPCQDIFLKDIQLTLESGENATAFCWNAIGFSHGTVSPPSCLSTEPYIKQKVEPIMPSQSTARQTLYR